MAAKYRCLVLGLVDLILDIPAMVVITFVSGAVATGFFRKLGGDIYVAMKKKLSQGFSKRLKAKVQFKIQLMHTELTVELNVKNLDQLDFVVKNIIELIRKHENDGLNQEYFAADYRVTDDNQWEKIRTGQDPEEKEFKGGFRFQNHRNLATFTPDETDYEHEYKVFRQEALTNNHYHAAIIDINNKEEFDKMLELRKKVYIDELGWIKEEDNFYDNEHAVYIVVYDEQKNQAGSMRILKPESRWMIEKEFKVLLNGYEINKTSAIEITRLVISVENRHKLDSLQASVRLFQCLFQWMKAEKFESLYMVVRPEYFRFFKMEGFCPERIGINRPDFDFAVAGKIDVDVTMPFLKENRYDLWEWITQS